MTAFLKPLTPEAKACLGTSLLKIPDFPFRVGRESRTESNSIFPNSRRRPDSSPNNDLYLTDPGQLLNISREHFQIEQRNGGTVSPLSPGLVPVATIRRLHIGVRSAMSLARS
jgi:hypothetical protein